MGGVVGFGAGRVVGGVGFGVVGVGLAVVRGVALVVVVRDLADVVGVLRTVAGAEVVLVAFDYAAGAIVPLTDGQRAALTAHLT